MQELIIRDNLTYGDLIDWIRLQSSFSSVGICCQRDLSLYLVDELLKVENYCFTEATNRREQFFDNNNEGFFLVDGEQKTIDIQSLDDLAEIPNIVCLMEDCLEHLPKFYKCDESKIYICNFEED